MPASRTVCPIKINVGYFRTRILTWGHKNFRNFPWRNTGNAWHALVAEIVLQRTRADQVVPAYNWFISCYSTPEEFAAHPSKVFTNLGLPERDQQFLSLNRILADRDIPSDKTDLLKLPGIGEYISSAFLSLHMQKRALLIDSNVVRVYGRFFGFETDPETRRKKWFEDLTEAVTPKRAFKNYNYGIIDFSREICKLKPLHDICPIKRKCHLFLMATEAEVCNPRHHKGNG